MWLTKSTVTKQLNGNSAQMSATWRHENSIPKPKTTRKPAWCDSNAIVIIAPRILGSLISLTYVMAGVSFSPIQNPINVKPTQINGNDCANPSTIHVIVNGMVSSSNVLRRPIRSLSGPLSNAPIGCAMYAQVAENGKNKHKWNLTNSFLAVVKRKAEKSQKSTSRLTQPWCLCTINAYRFVWI